MIGISPLRGGVHFSPIFRKALGMAFGRLVVGAAPVTDVSQGRIRSPVSGGWVWV